MEWCDEVDYLRRNSPTILKNDTGYVLSVYSYIIVTVMRGLNMHILYILYSLNIALDGILCAS